MRKLAIVVLGAALATGTLHSQNLGLEGETGVFVTPLAYTVSSPAGGFGAPSLGYHFLDAGGVIGTFSKISITEGAFGRLEFGYTRDVHTAGDNPGLSPLWHSGFDIAHAKANLLPENAGGMNWLPAISTGFLVRAGVRNVGGAISGKDTNNEDVYLVASKTITALPGLPILLSGGIRGTNAELWGMAGNANRFEGLPFGAAAFVLSGPFKSKVVLATEVAPQPPHPENLAAAKIHCLIAWFGLPEPIDLDIDPGTRVLYWTDRGDPPRGNTVNRAPLDVAVNGRKAPQILFTHLLEGIGLALDPNGGRMFFTDLGGSIYRADLDGSNQKTLLYALGNLTGVAYADVVEGE
jgi:hypothetical protein